METHESFAMLSSDVFGFVSGFLDILLFELIEDSIGLTFHGISLTFYANFAMFLNKNVRYLVRIRY